MAAAAVRPERARLRAGDALRLAAPCLGLLGVGALLFPGAGRDDVYLTYWPAHALCHYGDVLNFNGELVEQSSSLLHVVVLSLLCRAGIAVPIAGYVLGIACGALAVLLAGRLAARVDEDARLPAMWLTASSSVLAYWSFGGLEGPLAACVGTSWLLAASACLRHPGERSSSGTAGAAFVLATFANLLVRPEVGAVAACCAFGVLAWLLVTGFFARGEPGFARRHAPRVVWVALGVVLVALAIAAFRKWHWDSAFPQPVLAKRNPPSLGGLRRDLGYGLGYVRSAWVAWPLLLAAIGGSAAWVSRLSRPAGDVQLVRAMICAYVAAYGAFIVMVGGDWMEGGRFFLPIVPMCAVIAADGARSLLGARAKLVLVAICVVSLGVSVAHARTQSMTVPLWQALALRPAAHPRLHWFEAINREHRRNDLVLDTVERTLEKLAPDAQHPAYVALQNSGLVGYGIMLRHFGRVKSLDMHGLSDRYITRTKLRAQLESWPLGLHSSLAFVLEHFETIHAASGIPKPALLVWQSDPSTQPGWEDAFGYRTAYVQRGRMLPELWGRPLGTNQVISLEGTAMKRAGLHDVQPLASEP